MSIPKEFTSFLSRKDLIDVENTYFQKEMEREIEEFKRRAQTDIFMLIEAGFPALALNAAKGDYNMVLQIMNNDSGNYKILVALCKMAKEDNVDLDVNPVLMIQEDETLTHLPLSNILDNFKEVKYYRDIKTIYSRLSQRDDFQQILKMEPISNIHREIIAMSKYTAS